MNDDDMGLYEIAMPSTDVELLERAADFLSDGRSRFSRVHCFDFVPSNYETAWACLSGLPRGKLCEWGSGMGIVVGLAELLNFEAVGIEVDPDLAEASRQLLKDHGLHSQIITGSYLEIEYQADYYYAYTWAGQRTLLLKRFLDVSPEHARLVNCYSQNDLRCYARRAM